jgi:hypothetical protein
VRLLVCRGTDSNRISGRVTGPVIDVGDFIGIEAPAALLRCINVHNKGIAVELCANLDLMSPLDEGEVVCEVKHPLTFGSTGRTGAQRDSWIGFLGISSEICGICQEGLTVFACDVRGNSR